MRPHTRARRYWAAGGVWWRLAALEKPKARERMSEGGKGGTPGHTLAQPRVRDLVGPAIGVSGRTWEPRGDETSAAAGTVRGRGGGDTGRFVTLAGHLTHRCAPAAPNTQTVTQASRCAHRGTACIRLGRRLPYPLERVSGHMRGPCGGGSRTPDLPVWTGLGQARSGVTVAMMQVVYPCGRRVVPRYPRQDEHRYPDDRTGVVPRVCGIASRDVSSRARSRNRLRRTCRTRPPLGVVRRPRSDTHAA